MPVTAVMAYDEKWMSRSIYFTSTVDEGKWLRIIPGHFTYLKTKPVFIQQEVGWAPASGWTLWRREISFLLGKSNCDILRVPSIP